MLIFMFLLIKDPPPPPPNKMHHFSHKYYVAHWLSTLIIRNVFLSTKSALEWFLKMFWRKSIDSSQKDWLKGHMTNHNAKSAILSDSYGRKRTINNFFYLLDCVWLMPTPTPTLNNNAKTVVIVCTAWHKLCYIDMRMPSSCSCIPTTNQTGE